MKGYTKIMLVGLCISIWSAEIAAFASASARVDQKCEQYQKGTVNVNCGNTNGLTVNNLGGGTVVFGNVICNTQVKQTLSQQQTCQAQARAQASASYGF